MHQCHINYEILFHYPCLGWIYYESVAPQSAQKNSDLSIHTRHIAPTLPFPEWCLIVAYLDGVQAHVASLKRLQAETTAELDALFPSILDKAFRGEL